MAFRRKKRLRRRGRAGRRRYSSSRRGRRSKIKNPFASRVGVRR